MPGSPDEIVRRVVDASNRQDMEAFVALFDERAEVRSAWDRALSGDSAYRGHEGGRAWAAEAWENVNVQVDIASLVPYGPFVLLLGTIRTLGRAGGTALGGQFGAVLRVEGGRIVLYEGHLDHGDALIALGEHVKASAAAGGERGMPAGGPDRGR